MLQAERSPVQVPDKMDFFQFTLSFQPHYGPGVDSASNRYEYQESSWWVKSGRRVRLTALPPSVSRKSENVGASTSRNPKGIHGLYRDNFTLPLFLNSLNCVNHKSKTGEHFRCYEMRFQEHCHLCFECCHV
jgi:hypothetical protein